jgi:hypothetical protein
MGKSGKYLSQSGFTGGSASFHNVPAGTLCRISLLRYFLAPNRFPEMFLREHSETSQAIPGPRDVQRIFLQKSLNRASRVDPYPTSYRSIEVHRNVSRGIQNSSRIFKTRDQFVSLKFLYSVPAFRTETYCLFRSESKRWGLSCEQADDNIPAGTLFHHQSIRSFCNRKCSCRNI